MYTQCPQCLRIYAIDEDALQASLGIVHCGGCNTRFDALRSLSDSLPDAPLAPLPEGDPESRTPTLTEAVPPAAYEAAARRRRAQRHAESSGGQHQLELAAAAAAAPEQTDAAPRPDDWFAGIESELATAPADAPEASTPVPDVAPSWDIDLSDPARDTAGNTDAGVPAAAGQDGPAVAGEPDEPAGAAPPDANPPWMAVPGVPAPDQVAITMMPAAADANPAAPARSGVVSPRLLEGDVFGADTGTDDAADVALPRKNDTDAAIVDLPEPAGPDWPAAPADGEAGAKMHAAPDAAGFDAPSAAAVDPDGEPPPPVYVRPRRRFATRAGLAWFAGCLLLAVVLAAQLAWADRVELIRNPATRAWAQRACRSIPCHLPPIRDPARIELLSRDVRPDPNAAGALTITATVRNDAGFRQAWPVVVVELTDFDNRAVAMRRFRPAEYMPDPAKRAAGIAPGATAALAFEVVDPGKSAGGFRFGFE